MSTQIYEDKEYHVELGWPESCRGRPPALGLPGSRRRQPL